MLCQECQKRNATVHVTQIINGEQQVQHLCEQCAQIKGEFGFDQPPFSLQSLLTGLMNLDAQPAGQVVGFNTTKIQCDNCGLTYAQFGQIGRFGCSQCYTTFGERLLPLMRRIQGSTQHVGKIPERAGGAVKLRRNIEQLRQQLQALIIREEFEQAAEVRDQIRQMETDAQEGGERDE